MSSIQNQNKLNPEELKNKTLRLLFAQHKSQHEVLKMMFKK